MVRFLSIAILALTVAACQGERPKAPFTGTAAPAKYVPPAPPKAVKPAEDGTKKAKPATDAAAKQEGPAAFSYVEHIHGADLYPCTGHEICDVKSPKDGTLATVGGGAEFIDPTLISETEGQFFVENLFEGLVSKDAGGLPVPGVAKSWTISDDGLVWTFKLRDNAKWSNGRVVTAHDFVYSFIRKMSPEVGSQSAEMLFEFIKNGKKWFDKKVKDPKKVGVEAVDATTFKLTLERPTPFFMEYFKTAHYAPVPRETIEKHGKQWTRPENIVSNGAYRLKKRVHRGESVLVKNELYWGAADVRIPRVVVYFSDDEKASWQRYKAGQLHWYRDPVPPDRSEALIQDKRPDILIDPLNCYYYYGFRLDKAPFDRVEIRRAVNMAIDKERLVKHVTRQLQVPARGSIPPFVAKSTRYPGPLGDEFNPEEARRILAEAGYPNGSGFPAVELQYNTYESHRKVAEFVQRQLKQNLNIKITINNMEWKSLLKKLRGGDYQMSRFGWCGVNEPFSFLKPFKKGSANNYGGYENAEFDKLIEKSLVTRNHAERMKVLVEAEKLIQRDMPVAPLFYYTRAFLKVPVLRGFKAELNNSHLIKYMYWGDKE